MAKKPSTPKAPASKAPGAPVEGIQSHPDSGTLNETFGDHGALSPETKSVTTSDSGFPALASAAGRKWLEGELAKAERDERLGPAGLGWTNNEALREAVAERANFLRALIATLPTA